MNSATLHTLGERPTRHEFVTDAGAAIRSRSVRGEGLLMWIGASFFALFLVWAYFAVLDEVVRGAGKVIPTSQVQVIQNLEGGIVEEIHVREGEVIDAGQVLVTIDDTRFDASLQESRLRALTLEARLLRLQAEAVGSVSLPAMAERITAELPRVAEQERALFDERLRGREANRRILQEQQAQKKQTIAELTARVDRLSGSLELTKEELEVTRPLQDQGAVSEVEVLRLQRQVNDLKGELAEARLALPRAQAELAEVEQRLIEFDARNREEIRAELNEVAGELEALNAGNVALADRVNRTQVRSPIRGIVKSMQVRTVGGVVQPGMDLVEIVPVGESLLVEARVSPRDIAFLRPGLDAKVKLTAYDFAIYGGLDAQVEHISADTFIGEKDEPYYLVRVRTREPALERGGKAFPIIPGMTAEVDILVGEKSVLSYLLKPVLRARDTALREP
jgi:adhesin transport system membrane fusion protein